MQERVEKLQREMERLQKTGQWEGWKERAGCKMRLKGDRAQVAAALSHRVGSPALHRTQCIGAGERVVLKSLFLFLFPVNYFEIYLWRESPCFPENKP